MNDLQAVLGSFLKKTVHVCKNKMPTSNKNQ